MNRSRLLFWLICIAGLFILLNLPGVRDLYLVRSISSGAMSTVSPFQSLALWVGGGSKGMAGDLFTLRGAQKENEQIKEELASLEARVQNYDELSAENDQLRADLGFSRGNHYSLLAAEIVSRSANPLAQTIEINKGQDQGISVGQAVITSQGLAGKVSEVFPSSSRVLLITDPTSAVAVVCQRTRESGMMIGTPYGRLNLKYVDVGSRIERDDLVVTSGGSEYFPAGLAVGRINRIVKSENLLFMSVWVTPAVDFSTLERVFVVRR